MAARPRPGLSAEFRITLGLALLGGSTLIASPGSASTPERGTIRPGETITWSGGPLTGVTIFEATVEGVDPCMAVGCDEFLLNIRVPRSKNLNRLAFVEISLETQIPEQILLAVTPPQADPSTDFTFYQHDAARLIDPVRGVWRIRTVCFQCVNTTYTGTARTGRLRIPGAIAHRAGGRMMGPTSIRARLSQVGANAAEPTLGITEDGSVLYQGTFFTPGSFLPRPVVRRSADGGRTWERASPAIGPLDRHSSTNDPFLYVDKETSRAFTVDLGQELGCSQLSFTDDAGGTWTTSRVCGHTDHQHVFTGPPVTSPTVGYPNVVYFCAINGGAFFSLSTATTCAKSIDGGLTFVHTGTPPYHDDPRQDDGHSGVPGKCGGETGHGVVGPEGTVYLPRGWCGQPFLAISHDEGLTWERVQVADNGMPRTGTGVNEALEHEAGVAVDEKGNLYYAWVAEDRLPYLAVSRDGGATWTDPLMIGAPGLKESSLPGIDVGAPGRIAVVYMGSQNSPFPDPPGDTTTWNGYVMMTTTALDEDPVFFTATVNDPRDPLIVGGCGPQRCQAEFDFLDVVVATDGTPWASFVDGCVVDRCDSFNGEGIVGHLVGGPPLT